MKHCPAIKYTVSLRHHDGFVGFTNASFRSEGTVAIQELSQAMTDCDFFGFTIFHPGDAFQVKIPKRAARQFEQALESSSLIASYVGRAI